MIDNGEDRHNRPIKYGLSADERKLLVQRHFEQAEARKAAEDIALAQTLAVAKALKGG